MAVVALLGATLAYLARTRLAWREVDPEALNPAAVAYLAGGPWLAVYTSLAWLRAGGAVSARHGVLAAAGPRPWSATPLDRAVYRAAVRGAMVKELASDSWVARAIQAVRNGLERSGLAVPARARRAFLAGGLAMLVVGLARLCAGWIGGHGEPAILWPVLVLGVATPGLTYLLSAPATRAGAYAVARLRYDRQDTSVADPYQAAIRMALFGPHGLRATDPEFAEAVWIWPGPQWRYDRGDGGPMAGSRSDEDRPSFFDWGGSDSGSSFGGGAAMAVAAAVEIAAVTSWPRSWRPGPTARPAGPGVPGRAAAAGSR